jgi:hypothetical protein
MRKWIVLLVVAALAFLLGAKTVEISSLWKTSAYQVVSVRSSGKVQVFFIEKDPTTNADLLRCGQKITSVRARELATDLSAAADDADGTVN